MTKHAEEQIDAGAEALRQKMQGHKTIGHLPLKPWHDLPNITQKKWRNYAATVLVAAGVVCPREYL